MLFVTSEGCYLFQMGRKRGKEGERKMRQGACERKGRDEAHFFHRLIHSSLPTEAWIGLGLSQELGTQYRSHTQTAGTQLLEPSPAASRLCTGKELERGAGARNETHVLQCGTGGISNCSFYRE